ncbi:MAG: cytochrome c oxidase subunit II [SAR202 cluster bacterium]|jgi:cytochrome c oxidase subunit 2|nr:cytochrome c oxidase subunit II [SAR202 cluster bacterium]MDP6715130.1 cytochrome c oxidase subunit II [SAR202 cluster bacterium]
MVNLRLRPNKIVSLALMMAFAALMFGCNQSHPQSTFEALGPVAQSQLNLFWVIFAAGMLVFVLVEALLIYAVIKYRRRSDDEMPHQTHGNNTLEVTWTVIPTGLLVLVIIPTIFTIFDNTNSPLPPEEGGLVVDAVGHQWWFEFRYPHPQNAEEEIVFANELHVPVGEVINIRLSSVDVIHSFWVPKIGGKVDMVPGNDNTMWLQADTPGYYYAQCAEFCGVSHALMRFRVIAEPREDFDAWLLEQASPAFESQDPLIAAGKDVFQQAGCAGCHATDPDSKGRVGPNLTHLASRTTLAGGVFENRDEFDRVNSSIVQKNLREWLEDPDKAKPGNIMSRQAAVYTDPTKKLSEPDISALVAYLSNLK